MPEISRTDYSFFLFVRFLRSHCTTSDIVKWQKHNVQAWNPIQYTVLDKFLSLDWEPEKILVDWLIWV